MLIELQSTAISLQSPDDRIVDQWRDLFDIEYAYRPMRNEAETTKIVIDARLVRQLPSPPSSPPSYHSVDPPLAVYATQERQMLLRYSNTGHIQVNLPNISSQKPYDPGSAQIKLTERSFSVGELEDFTILALAPILRRRGLFLIHAFAAALEDTAVLFVGPSGSGKTSSGLALVSGGWLFLANDMTMISQSDAPRALLSPGAIRVTSTTFSLLPQLNILMKKYPQTSTQWKASIPRREFIPSTDPLLSAPIKFVFFPKVGSTENHSLTAVPRAVGLARLMESSLDQWDQGTWTAHIGFLERLSHEVEFHDLLLGHDMNDLPNFLENSILR